MTENTIRCRDQCGSGVLDQAAAVQAGWSYLQITGGWRCGACDGALMRAAKLTGAPPAPPGPDPLPPTSRGALPKETASTVLPVAVKG